MNPTQLEAIPMKNLQDTASMGGQFARALEGFDKLPDIARVRAPVAAALLGVSVPTVWRWAAAGKLPKPVKIGGATTWSAGQLRTVLSAQ